MVNKVQKMRKFTEEEIATVLRVAEGFYIEDNLQYLNDRDCYNLATHFVAEGVKCQKLLREGGRQISEDGTLLVLPEEKEEKENG